MVELLTNFKHKLVKNMKKWFRQFQVKARLRFNMERVTKLTPQKHLITPNLIQKRSDKNNRLSSALTKFILLIILLLIRTFNHNLSYKMNHCLMHKLHHRLQLCKTLKKHKTFRPYNYFKMNFAENSKLIHRLMELYPSYQLPLKSANKVLLHKKTQSIAYSTL